MVHPSISEEALWAEEVPASFLPNFDLAALSAAALEAVGQYASEAATHLTKEAWQRRNDRLGGLEERAESALVRIHRQADQAHRDINRLEKDKEGDKDRLEALKKKRAGLLGEGGRLKRQQEILAGLRKTSGAGLVEAHLSPLAAIRVRVL